MLVLVAIGFSWLSLPASEPAITYETVWVDGRAFVVGAGPQGNVAVGLTISQDLEIEVFLQNNSAEPITFDPAALVIEVQPYRRPVTRARVMAAEEVVSRARSRVAAARIFGVVGNAMKAGSRSQGYTRAEQDILARADQEQLAASTEAAEQRAVSAGDGLLRKHTLLPGTIYSGVVHARKVTGKSYRITFSFAGSDFVIEFGPPSP